jgi:hypothetical protein
VGGVPPPQGGEGRRRAAALEHARESIPDDALLSAATFEVRFTDGRSPGGAIRHGNKATYTRDTDADLIEAFPREAS